MLLEALELDVELAAPTELLLLVELSADGGLELLDLADARGLVSVAQGSAHLVHVGKDAVVHLGDGLVEDVLALREVAIGLADLVEEDLLLLAEGTDGLLAEHHGLKHLLLADLLGAGLEHADEVAGTGELEVEIGVVTLLVGGVDQQLVGVAVASDAHTGQRALEGHATHGERGTRAHGADDINRIDLVGDQRGGDNLDLVAEAVRERRAQRAVDHAGGEGALLGRTRLALEVTARDAAHGVHLLDEINGQREEVVVLALLGDDHGNDCRGVALAHEARTGGLLRELARLEDVVLAVEVELVSNLCHKSFCSSHLRLPHCRRAVLRTVRPRARALPAHIPKGRPEAPHSCLITECCRGCRGS